MTKYSYCTLGVGCEQAGVCFAAAHDQPDQCGWIEERPYCPLCGGDCSAANPPIISCPMLDEAPPLTPEIFDAMLDRIQQKEPRDETQSKS